MCDVPLQDAREKSLFWVRENGPMKGSDLLRLLEGQGFCSFHAGNHLRRLVEEGCLLTSGYAPGEDPVTCETALWSLPPEPVTVPPEVQPAAGRTWGRGYRGTSRVLGSGAHGTVHEAEQLSLKRLVAIKDIPRERLEASGNPILLLKRLEREVRALSRCSHPNIVGVIDAGGGIDPQGDLPYVVMERIEGPSLQALVESKGPLPLLEAALILRDALLALEYARSRGILHRDLKPSNILVTPAGAKLVDFGLAELLAPSGPDTHAKDESKLTHEGKVFLGTPMYQPTERHEGKSDVRTEIYSLLSVFYFALTGKHLFEFEKPPTFTDWAFAHYHADSRLVDIRHPSRRPDCPESMAAILRRALRRDPALRHASYAEILRELEPVLAELKATPPPPAAEVPSPLAGEAQPAAEVRSSTEAPKSPAGTRGVSTLLGDLEGAQGTSPSSSSSGPVGAPILSGLRARMAKVEERGSRLFGNVDGLHGQTGPFTVALLNLARAQGLMPILRRIYEAHSSRELDSFEECLFATAGGNFTELPPGTPRVPTGLGDYFHDALEIALNEADRWFYPEAAVQYAEAIVVFLEGALEAPELLRHRSGAALKGRPAERSRLLAGSFAALALAAVGVFGWEHFGRGNRAPSPKGAFELPQRTDLARSDETKKVSAPEEPRKPIEISKLESEKMTPPPKAEEKPTPKVEPPAPRLREKLAAQPPGPREAALMVELLALFEKRQTELRWASYDGLVLDLETFEKERLRREGEQSTASDENYAASHAKAARMMLTLARQAVRARLDQLRNSKDSVVLKTAAGGTVTGKVQDVDQAKITLQNAEGGTFTVELSKLALEEFVPDAGAASAELAFRGLTLHPAKTLGEVLDLEPNDESRLLWVPFLVRLARLEIRQAARDTALEAKDILLQSKGVEQSTTLLIHHVVFAAAESAFSKEKPRVTPVYGYLEPDFGQATRERESLELLLARQYSRVVASFRDTGSASVAAELLLGGLERDLDAGAEELLADGGWYNNDWKVWPPEPDLKKKEKLFNTRDPKSIVLQDPAGPRSLIMNDNTTRAPEGIHLVLSFKPEPGHSESAYWSFLLRGGKDRKDNLTLRVDAGGIGLYRSVFEAGAKDVCLAHSPLPRAPGDEESRAYTLVPGEDHLHVFADRDIVLSLPMENARIPNQLDFTVCYGKASVRRMLAKKLSPAAAVDGKKKETDK